MTDDEPRGSLKRLVDAFDLGTYEIETYLAVLEHGELTASETAEKTDVPQPRVYDTARSLAERGLVELHESRPMRIIARDPSRAFADIQSSLSDTVANLERYYTAPSRETEAVSLVKSRSTIRRYFEEVIGSADYELSLSLTPELLESFRDELVAAVDREVTTNLVLSPATETPTAEEFDYARIASVARARRGRTTPLMAIADGEYAIYASRGAVQDGAEQYAVIFNQSNLGFLLLGFFGTVLWTTADLQLAEEYDDSRGYPRQYASVRRCIKDTRATNGVLYVTIEGRDVLTGDRRTVRGQVVDTRFSPDEELATLIVDDGDGRVAVGGRMAAYEDVEAHRIVVGRDEPP
jgi:sugar-specific transcriptional regulator TrmB